MTQMSTPLNQPFPVLQHYTIDGNDENNIYSLDSSSFLKGQPFFFDPLLDDLLQELDIGH